MKSSDEGSISDQSCGGFPRLSHGSSVTDAESLAISKPTTPTSASARTNGPDDWPPAQALLFSKH
jgi:hypothetical protein